MAETILTNKADSTLDGAIISSDTTVVIQSGHTGRFPATGEFRILVTDNVNYEIMKVTAGAGTASWTVTRAAEPYAGTTASYGFASGSSVYHVVTGDGLRQYVAKSLLYRSVLTGTAATVTFDLTNHQQFNNLECIITARDSATTQNITGVRFNGDTGANYDWTYTYSSHGTTLGGTNSDGATQAIYGYLTGTGQAAGVKTTNRLWIPNFSSTLNNHPGTAFGTINESTSATYWLLAVINWRTGSPITSITFVAPNTFAIGSIFQIYGEM